MTDLLHDPPAPIAPLETAGDDATIRRYDRRTRGRLVTTQIASFRNKAAKQ